MRIPKLSLLSFVVLLGPTAQPLRSQSILNKVKAKVQQSVGSSTSNSSTGTNQHASSGAPSAVGDTAADSLLWDAALYRKASDCETAVARGANVNLSPAVGAHAGSTPLLSAIPLTTMPGESDGIDVVKCLVEHGADVNAAPIYQGQPVNSPIVKATFNSHADIAIYLAGKGAQVSTAVLGSWIGQQNPDAVRAMLAAGADAKAKVTSHDYAPGYTMLDYAQTGLNHAISAYKRSQTIQTKSSLNNACTIYDDLRSQGAVTGPASPVSGDPACNETVAQNTADTIILQSKADDAMHQEVPKSTKYCSTNDLLSNFYDCSCFAQKILEYREAHANDPQTAHSYGHDSASGAPAPVLKGGPLTNIIMNIDYSSCAGPAAKIAAYGAQRAKKVLALSPEFANRLDDIAACTGDHLAVSFLKKPVPNTIVTDSYFNSGLTVCKSAK